MHRWIAMSYIQLTNFFYLRISSPSFSLAELAQNLKGILRYYCLRKAWTPEVAHPNNQRKDRRRLRVRSDVDLPSWLRHSGLAFSGSTWMKIRKAPPPKNLRAEIYRRSLTVRPSRSWHSCLESIDSTFPVQLSFFHFQLPVRCVCGMSCSIFFEFQGLIGPHAPAGGHAKILWTVF